MGLIVMTGGTSGLGLVAARRFREERNRLLIGARGKNSYPEGIIPLNLMNLEEVRTFVASVEKAAGSSSINALVLNAGGSASRPDGRRL